MDTSIEIKELAQMFDAGTCEGHELKPGMFAAEALESLAAELRWSAFDWNEAAGIKSTADDYGITAQSSDDDLDRIVERMVADAVASGECDVLYDVRRYCEHVRSELRRAAE